MAHTTAETHFVCRNPKCRAQDRYKHFLGEPVPEWVNCWNCKAGRGLQPAAMAQQGIGMRRVDEVPNIHEARPQGAAAH